MKILVKQTTPKEGGETIKKMIFNFSKDTEKLKSIAEKISRKV